mmetsp:Transcript_95368/g.132474  ORF Transcript_95368/g.132474 Transcript_95368/m.132474 type:complete len:275 (+) Transcript_95368:69-893(+)
MANVMMMENDDFRWPDGVSKDDKAGQGGYSIEDLDLQECVPRPVPKMTDEIDRSGMPFIKRSFDPQTPVAREFQATLYTRLDLGYNIAVSSNGAFDLAIIVVVGKGPGTRWNDIYPDRQLVPGLRIMEVNGITTCLEIVDELRASSAAVLRLRRPVVHRVLLSREKGIRLGVTLLEFDEESVWVDQVLTSEGGLIPEWNKQNPVSKVTTGSRILEVNGLRGNSTKMLELLREDGVIELVVESHGPETANVKEPAAQDWYPEPPAGPTRKPGLGD